jgi:hypothetical protein
MKRVSHVGCNACNARIQRVLHRIFYSNVAHMKHVLSIQHTRDIRTTSAQQSRGIHERTTTAKNMGILKYHLTSLISYESCWPLACLGDLIKPNQASHQGARLNIKCFYAKSACLASNYRNISSLTLVQKVILGYLQRTG